MQPRSTPITIIFKAAALSCSTLFPPASMFPSFSVSFLFSFFSVLFLLHFEEKKAKSESVYRVSLDPVQNLCLLDENPAVSQKERGIRNWTINPLLISPSNLQASKTECCCKRVLVSHQKGAIIRGRPLFQILLTGSCALITPFAFLYKNIRTHLRETATNSAKIHSLARKSEHLRIEQIQ